jgi:hypothetical protein
MSTQRKPDTTMIQVSNTTTIQLDWLVAQCEGAFDLRINTCGTQSFWMYTTPKSKYFPESMHYLANVEYSTDWAVGGPIIEQQNITLIRANDDYAIDSKGFTTNQRIPQWFAQTSKSGHDIRTGYEGEYFDPCFMVEENLGMYGPSVLIAAMRCYVFSKLGDSVEVPADFSK